LAGIYRTACPYNSVPSEIDGLPNYFHLTKLEGAKYALLERGINPIAVVDSPNEPRIPAILISSSPHKTGSEQTPWHDTFGPDRGFARYYGDNKSAGVAPERVAGNAHLLNQFRLHTSPERTGRLRAVPFVLFRRVTVEGRPKGNFMFQGFGIVTAAKLVTQIAPSSGIAFANFAFDLAVFSMANEGKIFDWAWINSRRDPNLSDEECLSRAPKNWQTWTSKGTPVLETCRRLVERYVIVLRAIYRFYDGRKYRFENLASMVASEIVAESGAEYREGWLTPPTGDGGWDFVGRIRIGAEAIGANVVCLGQAKCEKPSSPTNGNSIARLVARLQRGWLGFYLTTSYFSAAVQKEVQTAKYPMCLYMAGVLPNLSSES
jgi:hypothetical protein